MEKTDSKGEGGRGMGVSQGLPEFFGNPPMISGKFLGNSRNIPGSRGMSPVTESCILKR